MSAFWYGLVVHFKIYPILYALPIYFFIENEKKTFFTKNRIVFTFLSATVFISLNAFFYYLYGF
jgi:phosphatidylinositol glycan class M